MSVTVEERLKANKLEMLAKSPGTLVKFEGDDKNREMIVDDRVVNKDHIPLLGRRGGQYAMRIEGNVAAIRVFSPKKQRWITAYTLNVEDIETDLFD